MNKERIEELAQAIEAAQHKDTSDDPYHAMFLYASDEVDESRNIEGLPSHFTLSWYYARSAHNSCETVGCIAGYCAGLYASEVSRTDVGYGNFVKFTEDALDIPHGVTYALCGPYDIPYSKITPMQAAQAVRNLLTLTDEDLDGDDIYAGRKDLATKLWGHVPSLEASTA